MRPELLEKALSDPEKVVVAQMAPAVRVSLGELFGHPAGEIMTKRIVGALRKLGFKYVFDTSFGADVAVVEESVEMKERLKAGKLLPMLNSCCPGTVFFLEHAYPDLISHLGTAKSPMEIVGVLIKTYFAEKKKINPKNIVSVAVMPCMVKKAEALRPELRLEGKLMVDGVLTTVELAEFMKKKGLDLDSCPEAEFDSLMGTASGGGQIFGSSGGVSEAALRNFAFLEGKSIEKIESKSGAFRGIEGVREAVFEIGGKEFRIAIVNSLRNAGQILNDPKKFESYHFIEIMACQGGCVGGAGQPTSTKENLEARRKGLYSIDAKMKMKAASQNPEVKKLYDEFLGEPGGNKAIRLIHTSYLKICTDCY